MKRWRVPLWLELSAAILIALLASNAVTFAIVESDRSRVIRDERLTAIEERLTAVARLLLRLPESDREDVLKIASVRRERVSIGKVPRVGAEAARDAAAEARVLAALGDVAVTDVRIAKRGAPSFDWFGLAERRRSGHERLSVAIGLGPGKWLNAEFVWPPSSLLPSLVLSVAVASLALIAMAVWLAYRLSTPLQRLSEASTAMARGRAVAPVPETGPAVLRNAAHAFNTMSRRLMATLENQRVLLASIAHDLRTPITSLRIKSEFIEDVELRDKMNESLDELQTTTEAALEAARTGMGEEPSREVDVSALIESMCADLSDMGGDVTFEEGPSVRAMCRPNEIKRAARNLVQNALRYGQRARVSVGMAGAVVSIVVDDDGPGLSAAEIEKVFDPFVRLEASRSRDTGGLGLGLTLARAMARGHGGDITLANRTGGGLRATLTLNVA
ncbi:MAG: ATP-binding protein [Alphaproteobacteria bacterium]|jgi:signal transduction histidine kinase|nr:ATP-binding protein [Alphaproteobacteria bacterium]